MVSRFITTHPRWLLAGILLMGAFFWFFLPQVTLSPNTDDFLAVNDPSLTFREYIRTVFPNDDFVVITFSHERLFRADNVAVLQEITQALSEKETIQDVKSLANANDMVGDENGFSVQPFLQTIPGTREEEIDMQQRAVSNPLYASQLISTDAVTAAIVVFTRGKASGSNYRLDLMRDIESVLEPYERNGYTFHVAGGSVINRALAAESKKDLIRFVPITFLLVVITIYWIFRNGWLLLLSLGGIAATEGALLGLAGFLDLPLNNASIAVIPIALALSMSDTVHIFSHLTGDVVRQHPDRRQALAHVLRQVLFPCFLTSVNTAIGFFSLSASGIPAVRSFGLLAGCGMIFEYLFTFGLVSPLLLAFRPERIYRDEQVHQTRIIPRFLRSIHRGVLRWPMFTLLLCVGISAWAAWQCRGVRAEVDVLNYFRSSSVVRRDTEFVKTHLTGIMPADILFEADAPNMFHEPEVLSAMDVMQTRVKSVPGVDKVISIVDYFKEMNASFHNEDRAYYQVPATRRMADQYMLLYSARDVEDYISFDGKKARMVLRLKSINTRVNAPVLKRLESIIKESPIPGVRVRLGGEALLNNATARVMVGEQLWNIVTAVGSIWLVMVLVLRSWKMATIFLVPNLFPILINFGVLGAASIPLDSGTSLVAAAAFGVIVDDTVHFFVRFQEIRRQGLDYFETLEQVSLEKGEAVASSFLILCAGFGVLVFSGFQPIMYFGLLNMLVMVVGFMGDQLLLKAIMVHLGRWSLFRRGSPSDVTTGTEGDHGPARAF